MATRGTERKQTLERELEPVALREASKRIGDIADEAAFGDKVIPITRRGRVIAAVIGRRDLDRLRQLGAA